MSSAISGKVLVTGGSGFLGINLIRVPINHHLFWNDQMDEPNPFGFEQLERLASICVAQGLYFLPDLHTTPGGQNPDWHSECRTGTPLFWEFEAFQKRAVKIWSAIAERLKDCTALLGYDLLNEPVLPSGQAGLLNRFYRRAITAIRKQDPRHLVFLEGDRFSMDFSSITPLCDPNWAYAYHFYPGVWNERLLDPAMDEKERRKAFASALGVAAGAIKLGCCTSLAVSAGLALGGRPRRLGAGASGVWVSSDKREILAMASARR